MPKYHQIDSSMVYGDPLDHPVKIKFHTDKISNALRETFIEIADTSLRKVAKKYPHWRELETNTLMRGDKVTDIVYGYINNKELTRMIVGQKAQLIQGTYIQEVPAHIRRTKRGNVRVKAHTKTYMGQKTVQISPGNWRVVNRLPEQKPKNPLVQANNKQMRKMAFVKLFKKHLQNTYRNSRIS